VVFENGKGIALNYKEGKEHEGKEDRLYSFPKSSFPSIVNDRR
jgi:hypothetical protein